MILIVFTSCGKDDVAVSGISLDKSTLSITKGETATLKAVVTPENATNQTVSWRSSNTLVASVDQNGNVTAVGGGTAEITAMTEDGKYQASCTVTVVVNASSITLSETEVSIVKGKSKTITASVHPDDATEKGLTWSTSNPNVATVENGIINAINGGIALITVTTANGKIQATCYVTVTVPVQGITISQEQLSLVVGQKYKLSATILPENATDNTVKWISSNNDIVSVNNGQVTAKSPGTAVIMAMSKDGDYTSSCTITVRKSENVDYNPYGDGQKW